MIHLFGVVIGIYVIISSNVWATTQDKKRSPQRMLNVKMVLIGDSFVGKTSILLRFADDKFNDSSFSTIGIDFKIVKRTYNNDPPVKIFVWDTAGLERFRTITTAYLREAKAIILVYDVTQRSSFNNLPKWIETIRQHHDEEDSVHILVGNKIDCDEHNKVVSFEEGKEFALKNRYSFLEVSAKDATNIEDLFRSVTIECLKNINNSTQNIDLNVEEPLPQQCCF